jgi:hypothetical protein
MLGRLRRVIAGGILVVLGLGLFSTGIGGLTPERSIAALALTATWCAVGIVVIAGTPWARLAGLALSVVGIVVGVSLATAGVDSPLAAVLFSAADAARWYVVMPVGYGLAILSAIAGLLLVVSFGSATDPGS